MNRKTTVKNFIVDMDHVIVLPEQSVAVVTQFKIRTSTTFIQNLVLRAGADSYYSITMSRTERQATSVPPVVRPHRHVIPPRYLDDFYVAYTVPHQLLHSDEQPTNGSTGSEPGKRPAFKEFTCIESGPELMKSMSTGSSERSSYVETDQDL